MPLSFANWSVSVLISVLYTSSLAFSCLFSISSALTKLLSAFRELLSTGSDGRLSMISIMDLLMPVPSVNSGRFKLGVFSLLPKQLCLGLLLLGRLQGENSTLELLISRLYRLRNLLTSDYFVVLGASSTMPTSGVVNDRFLWSLRSCLGSASFRGENLGDYFWSESLKNFLLRVMSEWSWDFTGRLIFEDLRRRSRYSQKLSSIFLSQSVSITSIQRTFINKGIDTSDLQSLMKKEDIKSTLSRFVSFFRSSKSDVKNDDNLSTKTGGAKMERRGQITDTSQFEDYLQSIPKNDMHRLKSRKGAATRTATNNSVNMTLLEKCYKVIPSQHFIEHAQEPALDFGLFNRSRKKLEEAQDKVSLYLDEIEICLFNQVTSRFDEFISVLRTIESLDLLLNDNLHKLSVIRTHNKSLNLKLVFKAQCVNKTLVKLQNMQKLSTFLSKMKLIETAKTMIKGSIHHNKDSCVDIIKQLRENKEDMLKLQCMEDYDDKVEECEFVIKKDFTENFTEDVCAYLSGGMAETADFWGRLENHHDLLNQDKGDCTNNATMFLDQDVICEDKNTYNPEAQQRIVDIVMNGWRNGELAVGPTKGRIQQFLSKLFNKFLEDMQEFCLKVIKQTGVTVVGEDLQQILNRMSIQFYTKVLEYYFSLHMKYLRRLFSVCRHLINSLLQSSTTTQHSLQSHLHNLVQGIFNIQLSTIKFVLQKVIQLLNLKRLDSGLQFYRFKSYITMFEQWQQFFNAEVPELTKYIIPQECPFRDRVFVLRGKMNGHLITSSKAELVGGFAEVLHKKAMGVELRKAMEEDTWAAVDIPTDFYETIGYLLTGDVWSNRRNIQTTVLESSIFFDRSIRRGDRGSERSTAQEPPELPKVNLRIIKNECIIQGHTYKITQAFLLLLQIIEQYIKIAETYPFSQQDISIKLAQLTRFYNSYSCQLIIGAGAVVLGKIKSKNITARHLCISSLCLEMLMMLLKRIGERVKMPELPKLLESLHTHHLQILKKLKAIMMAKVVSSLDEIDLQLVPSKGTQGIVSSARTLYDILKDYLIEAHIKQVFDKDIFQLYVDRMAKFQIKELLKAQSFKQEIGYYFNELRFLEGVVPDYWQRRQSADSLIVRVFQAL